MTSTRTTFFVIALIFLLPFTGCKKDIVPDQFEKESNLLKIVNVNAPSGFQLMKDDGGFVFVSAVVKDYQYSDIKVQVMDQQLNILSETSFGGSKNENIEDVKMDQSGNIYIVGSTESPDLQVAVYPFKDAYLAKLDPNGNLLWLKVFADTAGVNRGFLNDQFMDVHLVNDRIYCVGVSANRQTTSPNGRDFNQDNIIVEYDVDGNFIDMQVLPNVFIGELIAGRPWLMHSKELNDDLIISVTYDKLRMTTGYDVDTTCILMRYNPRIKQVLWTKYFTKNEIPGDLFALEVLPNGRLFGLESYAHNYFLLDENDGHEILTESTGLQNESSFYGTVSIAVIGDAVYCIGFATEGSDFSFGLRKPWIAKFTNNGDFIFSKKIDIDNAMFTSCIKNSDSNLQLQGTIYPEGLGQSNLFVVTLDPNGQLVE